MNSDDPSPAPPISKNEMFAFGGITAIVIAVWSKIQGFLSMLASVFIEQFAFNGDEQFCVLRYLKNDCKFQYSWKRDIHTHFLYLKKHKTRRNCLFIYDKNWIFFKWKYGGLVWFNNGTLTIFKFARFFDRFADLIFEDHCNLTYEDDRDNFMIRNVTGNSRLASGKSDESPEACEDIINDRTILLNIRDGILKPIYFSTDDFLSQDLTNVDPFSDYYLSPDAKRVVFESTKWLEHEKWFKERNINWKRGYCLHGLPGCGKSSFLIRLAKKLKIPLFVFNLSTLTNEELINEWNRMQKPCIALFEDFDSVFEKRKNVSDVGQLREKLTFDTVLNIVDGTNSCDGVLTILTTNHLDKLDTAILRAGRMDKHVEFKSLGTEGKEFIAKKILNGHVQYYQNLLDSSPDDESNAEFENRCIQVALEEFWKTS